MPPIYVSSQKRLDVCWLVGVLLVGRICRYEAFSIHHQSTTKRNNILLGHSSTRLWRSSHHGSNNPLNPTNNRNLHDWMLDQLINSQRELVTSPPLLKLKSEVLLDLKDSKKSSSSSPYRNKQIMKIQRFERIPAWPLTKGIGFKAMELILPGKAGRNVASRLESIYGGGMDCPNIFVNSHQEMQKTSPFLMLVHHNHSFRVNDPLRYIEKSLIPEGFPSHPHRGMLTVTICLAGGMVHRDSLGIKQVFGAGDEKYLGKHTQALNFGAGVVHELMWDNTISPRRRRIGSPHSSISQEIYQIWVDLPQEERMSNISVDLLGGQEETPTVIEKNVGSGEFESSTLVIAGSHKHHKSKMVQKSDFTILQVTLEPGKKWIHSSPTLHDSTILYMRKGSATIEGRQIPLHCTAFCSCDGQDTVVVAGTKGADFLFLSGEPLDQNVVARGSMVGETNRNIAQAAQDAKGYKMGKPWDEGLSDAQWKHHAERYPCEYEMD